MMHSLPKGWKSVKLSELAYKCIAKNRDYKYKLVFTNYAIRGIIPQSEHFDKNIAIEENIDGYFIVNNGDFVYNPRISTTAPCGPIGRNHLGKTGVMSPLYTVFKLENGNIDDSFIEYYFLSSSWHRYMKSIANYGARHDRMSITDDDFFAMPIPLPPLPEQKAIAEILTTADNLIAVKQRLITEKQKQKQWIMQNLLTGKIRLPGFKGKWEISKIKNICKIIGGGTPSTKKQEYWNGKTPWISSSDVIENNIYQITPTRFITDSAIKYSATKICPKNTILIVSRVGVGKIAVAPFDLCTSQDFTNLSIINQNVTYIAFTLFVHLNKAKFKSQGTSIKGLTVSEIKNIAIILPPLPEQQAIAKVLTTADCEIELLQNELEQQKLVKKHLMQQLLTGKTRVKEFNNG